MQNNGYFYDKFTSLKNVLLALMPPVFLPRMTLSIFSGWLIFFTSEELIKFDFNLTWDIILLIFGFVLLLSMVFMYNEVRKGSLSLFLKTVIFRIVVVTIIGFIISYTIGYFLMPTVSKNMISRSETIIEYQLKTKYVNSIIDSSNILTVYLLC